MHSCDINNCFLANNLINSLYFSTKEELVKHKININNSSHIHKHADISHIIRLKLDKIPYNKIKTYDYDNIKLLLNIETYKNTT